MICINSNFSDTLRVRRAHTIYLALLLCFVSGAAVRGQTLPLFPAVQYDSAFRNAANRTLHNLQTNLDTGDLSLYGFRSSMELSRTQLGNPIAIVELDSNTLQDTAHLIAASLPVSRIMAMAVAGGGAVMGFEMGWDSGRWTPRTYGYHSLARLVDSLTHAITDTSQPAAWTILHVPRLDTYFLTNLRALGHILLMPLEDTPDFILGKRVSLQVVVQLMLAELRLSREQN